MIFLAAQTVGMAASIYTENFNNTAGVDRPVTYLAGLAGYAGATAAATTNAQASIRSATGTGDGSVGYLYVNTSPGGQFAIVNTGLSLSLGSASKFTWDMQQANSAGHVRILIQLGGSDWYVSNTVVDPLVNATGVFSTPYSTYASELAFSLLASNWSTFTLSPETSMAVGSTLTADLPSSTITGIGFYLTNTSSSWSDVVRLDTVAVIPEPSTVALALLAAGAVFLMRR